MKRLRVLLAELTVLAFAFTQIASAALTNRFVVKDNPGAGAPYDSPANAAGDIQTAINYAYAGETVLVYAATYDAGGLAGYPPGTTLTNRVVINKAITVRSVDNDPTTTIIKGAGTINGNAAVRCVYMTNGASLIGFRLTNGATRQVGNNNGYGGGAWCDTNAIISNCVIAGNSAYDYGCGVHSGILYNCTLIGNKSNSTSLFGLSGGGAYGSILRDCTLTDNSAYRGGGAWGGILYNCTLNGNRGFYGGGARLATLYNCMLISNSTVDAGNIGGGAWGGILYNCTVVNNTAENGGGVFEGTLLYNSIVYFNTATAGSNYAGAVSFTNCLTAPAQSGWAPSNITGDPMFADRAANNYRLMSVSPCVNTGLYQAWMAGAVDLDGRLRVDHFSRRVDMGAYEFLPAGTLITGY